METISIHNCSRDIVFKTRRSPFPAGQGTPQALGLKMTNIFRKFMKQKHLCAASYSEVIGIYSDIDKKKNINTNAIKVLGITISEHFKSIFKRESRIGDKELFLVNCLDQYFAARTIMNIFSNKIFECEKFKQCVEGSFDKMADVKYTESLIRDTLYCNYLPVVYSNYYDQGYKEFSAYLTNRELCHIPIDVNDQFAVRSYLQNMASNVSYPLVATPTKHNSRTNTTYTYPIDAPNNMRNRHNVEDNFVDTVSCNFMGHQINYSSEEVYSFMDIIKSFDDGYYVKSEGGQNIKVTKINLESYVTCDIEKFFYNSQYILRPSQYLARNRPICAVLHPDLIEGISFPMSPNMYVLEVPEGFGKRDQIYARILRFIYDSEPTILRKKESDFIKKVLCGYDKSYEWSGVVNCPPAGSDAPQVLFRTPGAENSYSCQADDGQVSKQAILDQFKTTGMKDAIDLLLRESKCDTQDEVSYYKPKSGSNEAKERGIIKTVTDNICKSAVYLCDTQKRFLITHHIKPRVQLSPTNNGLGERIEVSMNEFITTVNEAGSGNITLDTKNTIEGLNTAEFNDEYSRTTAYYGFLLQYDAHYHSNMTSQDLILTRSQDVPFPGRDNENITIIINRNTHNAKYFNSEKSARNYLTNTIEAGKHFAAFKRLPDDSENIYLTLLEFDTRHKWIWQMKKQIIQYSRTTNGDTYTIPFSEEYKEALSWLIKDWSFLVINLPWEIEKSKETGALIYRTGKVDQEYFNISATALTFVENKINADMILNKMLIAIYYKDARNRSTFNKVKETICEIKLAQLLANFSNVKIMFDGYDELLLRKNKKNEKIYKEIKKKLEAINDGDLSAKMEWDQPGDQTECSRLNFQTKLNENLSWTPATSSCILRKIQHGGVGNNTFIYHNSKDERIKNWKIWYNWSQENKSDRLVDDLSEELVFEIMITYTLNMLKQSVINFSIENSSIERLKQTKANPANENLNKWLDDESGKVFSDYIVNTSDLTKLIGIPNFSVGQEEITFTEEEFQDICAETIKEIKHLIVKENKILYKLHRDYFTIGVCGYIEKLKIDVLELPEIAYYRDCKIQNKIFKKFVAKNEIPVLIDEILGTVWGINTKKYLTKNIPNIVDGTKTLFGNINRPTVKEVVEDFINKSKMVVDIIYPNKVKYRAEFIEEQAELGNFEYDITHNPEFYINNNKADIEKVFNLDKSLYKIAELSDIDTLTYKFKSEEQIDGFKIQVVNNEFITDKPIGFLNGSSIVWSDDYLKELIIEDIYLETTQIILSTPELSKLVESEAGMETFEQTLNTMIKKYTEMSVDELTNIPNELKQDENNFWVVYANKQELALLESNGLCIPIKDCVSEEECSEKEQKRRERKKMKDLLKRKYQEYKPGAMPIKSKIELEREALESKRVEEEEKEAFLRWGQVTRRS
jgi:hypothetical protein